MLWKLVKNQCLHQDMSKPQLAAYNNKMKAKHIRDWLLSNNKDDVLLAIACASAYHSYTHTQQNRPTNISFDVAEEFTSDYEPEGYQEHERHASYQELRNSVGQSYSDVDRPTVDYFIGNLLSGSLNTLLQSLRDLYHRMFSMIRPFRNQLATNLKLIGSNQTSSGSTNTKQSN